MTGTRSFHVDCTALVTRVVSGGQTGADRGGLDAALALGIEVGGWCPKGRRAEDGVIPISYPLTEMRSKEYLRRTERNVIDSDATVVFTRGRPAGGSRRTVLFAEQHGRPCLHVDLKRRDGNPVVGLAKWLNGLGRHHLTLNVAGSRESECPGIAEKVRGILAGMDMQVYLEQLVFRFGALFYASASLILSPISAGDLAT